MHFEWYSPAYLIGTQGGFNSNNYTYKIDANGNGSSSVGRIGGLEEQCGSIYKPGTSELILGAGLMILRTMQVVTNILVME